MKRMLSAVAVLLLAGCAVTGGTVPVAGGSSLEPYAGRAITLDGAVSAAPWQHTVAPPDGHGIATYFDHGNLQTVAYSNRPLPPDLRLRLHGTVIAVAGRAKRPGEEEQYFEYHIVVDAWEELGQLARPENSAPANHHPVPFPPGA